MAALEVDDISAERPDFEGHPLQSARRRLDEIVNVPVGRWSFRRTAASQGRSLNTFECQGVRSKRDCPRSCCGDTGCVLHGDRRSLRSNSWTSSSDRLRIPRGRSRSESTPARTLGRRSRSTSSDTSDRGGGRGPGARNSRRQSGRWYRNETRRCLPPWRRSWRSTSSLGSSD